MKVQGSMFRGPAARSKTPLPLETDSNKLDEPISPTSGAPRTTAFSTVGSSVSPKGQKRGEFGDYRRDLAVLDTAGDRIPQVQQTPPTAADSTSQIAPWMAGAPTAASSAFTSFYHDSSEDVSQASELSPSIRPGTARTGNTIDSPNGFLNDERRPSLASITTASSSGSKQSAIKNGPQTYKKLQGFFGEDNPGKDDVDSSGQSTRKESRERKASTASSHTKHRDRQHSEATAREGSPVSSRPRTPVPSSDVVPFLYQDSQDISLYGEAPVRQDLSGPDRVRYVNSDPSQQPPKTAGSGRSSTSQKTYLPGHHHRHNRSSDETKPARTSRPGATRENSTTSIPKVAPRKTSSVKANGSSHSRSPDYTMAADGSAGKRGVLNMFRRHKGDKEGHSHHSSLRHLPGSVRSLQAPLLRSDSASESSPDNRQWGREGNFPGGLMGSLPGSELTLPLPKAENGQFGGPTVRPSSLRQGTFNKLPFGKRKAGRGLADDHDLSIGPTERKATPALGSIFDLDTNLMDMEGILTHPPALTPLDNSIFAGNVEDEAKFQTADGSGILGWNAPDSWAVKKVNDDNMSRLPEIDDGGIPTKADENATPYCIRVFKSDGTFATLSMPLNATVNDVINQLGRKTNISDNLINYQIIMKKHDLQRILGHGERPVVIQKRLLEQAGYVERDKLEDVGREDNSYLCRFQFVPARESGYAAISQDPGFGKVQKFSHVDLSGRNLVTIPIALYLKATEIISLNLSRNLSLDLPVDFVQSCLNLRDIKFVSNEAWKLPPSISTASRLTILDVSNNRLEQLEHIELSKLQGLISLKLANNRLSHLPPYFGAFKSMRTLNVSSNFLEKFPTFLCGLGGLVDLDMSFNSISTIPDDIGKLTSLERFVITNNRLSGSLPESFKSLSNLREVDIRYNALSSIDVVASLPRVEQLSADHNSVSVFEGTFEKIRVLRLNSNPVTKFEITNSVPTLTTLILSNAKLAHIPDVAFERMPNLIKLVLDKNHFVSLPIHIGRLRNLEHFSIARNSLSSLPSEIGCLTELRVLDVRQNNLKKLPMEIWWANKLETLNISSNVLDNFPKPASRPPQVPGEVIVPQTLTDKAMASRTPSPGLSQSPSFEEIGPLGAFGQRRASQLSGGFIGGSPAPDRRSSVASIYGRGGRGIARKGSQATGGAMTPTASRKDSSLSAKLMNTFAASLKNLYLADNQLDDDVFDELSHLGEIRVLNLSYNDINDMPQRSIRSWPQLVELYLSGNELTSLPSDDFEEFSLLQILHINGNKFQTLPAELAKAHRLAVLDCGNNSLKYNVSNWPYDWNWTWNTALKYLNLSGNKRLEIKPNLPYGQGAAAREGHDLTNFSTLQNLRILGLMDVTLTIPTIPDETEDRRVRTSGSLAGSLAYGMADSLGRNEHLSTIDMVVPRFNSSESETLLGMFDGQAQSSGGSKIAKYLHENFGRIFSDELRKLNAGPQETPEDALRRTFLLLNKDLATAATQHMEERSLLSHRGAAAPAVLNQADLNSGGVATVMFLQHMELYVANVGDAQAMLIHSEGNHRMLTRKHDPAEPNERQRIRDAGGWVSRQGKLNDILEVSRAFGYVQLVPAVQAAPNVTHVTLKEQDEMILIASRELWEYLPPDFVVDVARNERLDLMRASQKLRDLAMAYGATGKIMVMMIGVSDLKKRERIRLNRGTSISMGPSGLPDEGYIAIRRGKRPKGEVVEDSMLRRLDAEVQAPVGDVSIVFTDIKGSTALWELSPSAMRSAIKLHNEVMRRQLRIIGGYEVKTEGDAFMVSFPTATSALLWCFAVQAQLLEVQWPSEVLSSAIGQEVYDNDQNLIYRGLSVRMGIHFGNPVCENDPVTRRMDYFGPMVNRAARIEGVADGGQIAVSSDFINEIQRCLETFTENDRSDSIGSEDTFDNDLLALTIRRELRSLSSQGFEVKDMGEKKLKGLENPEYIYLMYPHALSGRMDYINGRELKALQDGEAEAVGTAPVVTSSEIAASTSLTDDDLQLMLNNIWSLWAVSLRLESLCDKLQLSGALIHPPRFGLMELMKKVTKHVTDELLINFLSMLITRVESSVSVLCTRFVLMKSSIGNQLIDLDQISMPLDDVMSLLQSQTDELNAYRIKYGALGGKV
ncbi:MAG: cysteinyl-tRNA synthetase [Claussenomyces sp. TS43310]|nr:MAG: cysteinyl-tRNA synthetase [Claussenomyces sp. TS43310]